VRQHKVPGGFIPESKQAVTGPTALVESRQETSYVRLPGRVRCSTPVVLSSRLLAPILQINVSAGQEVHKGQELVVLDDRDLRAKLESAREEIKGLVAHELNASNLLEKLEKLGKDGSVASQDVENQREVERRAQAGLKATERSIEQLEVMLGFTRISSPVDGIVVDRRLQAGEMAAPGVPIVQLYDPAELRFEVPVPESLVGRVGKEPMTVELGSPPTTWPATLYNLTPSLDGVTRSILVRLDLPKEAPRFDGAYGVLLLPEQPKEKLVVPEAALYRIGQVSFVDVVVGTDQGTERRLVQPGRAVGDQIEVLSGLRAGERVRLQAARQE
jgi:RND family efflux transporter MFP subunit